MVLERDNQAWLDEIRLDEEWLKKKLASVDDLVAGFHGPAYNGKGDPGTLKLRNHAQQVVSLYLPTLAHNVPDVRVVSTRDDLRFVAQMSAHALNRWVYDTRFTQLSDKLATDYLFYHAATVTTVEPRPGYAEAEDPWYWPQIARIPRGMFGWDRVAKSFDDTRYQFHLSIVVHDELIERAQRDKDKPEKDREGWNVEAVKRMAEDFGVDEHRTEKPGADRGEVAYYEVYVPGLKIDETKTDERGYRGAILTFAHTGTDKTEEIREAFDFWGPRGGPYTLYGCYTVPDHSVPLSLLMMTKTTADALSAVALANNNSAERWKRQLFTDSQDLADAILSGEHDAVVVHKLLEKDKLIVHEYAGLSEQQMVQEQRLQEMLNADSGISETMRSNVQGDVTATAEAIASSSASVRQGYITRRLYDATEHNLGKVLWYVLNDPRIVSQIAPMFAAQGGPQQFRGGSKSGIAYDFPDLELRIQVGSMGRRSPEQQSMRAQELLATIQGLVGAQMQFPTMDGRKIAEQVAEMQGFPDLPDMANWEATAAIGAQMMQAQVTPPSSQNAQPKPRAPVTMGTAARQGAGRGPSMNGKQMKPQNMAVNGSGSSATATRTRKAGGL